MGVTLHGYRYSVYAWIARTALAAKGVDYAWREINPFAPDVPREYLELHPFKRVPVLQVDSLVIYETSAITRYVDEAFDGPPLQPLTPTERARCNQVISVVGNYAYWPLVRQVFAHGVIGPRLGRPSNEAEVAAGLESAPRVLDALERLAGDRGWLVAETPTLADFHLAPMIGYFAMHEKGMACLSRYRRLSSWWSSMAELPAFIKTAPDLPGEPSVQM